MTTEVERPDMPGGFIGDIWFGDPVKTTLGTHRWNGTAWLELPSDGAGQASGGDDIGCASVGLTV